MTKTTTPHVSVKERSLATWESAVARTLNPHLGVAQSEQVWDAVIANRSTPNADTFQDKILDVLHDNPQHLRDLAATLVANLRDVIAVEG